MPSMSDTLRNAEPVETVDVTPHWPGLRAYVRNVYRTDRRAAERIAAEMGCEAPTLPPPALEDVPTGTTLHAYAEALEGRA